MSGGYYAPVEVLRFGLIYIFYSAETTFPFAHLLTNAQRTSKDRYCAKQKKNKVCDVRSHSTVLQNVSGAALSRISTIFIGKQQVYLC